MSALWGLHKSLDDIIPEDKVLQSIPFTKMYLKTKHLKANFCGYLLSLFLVE